MLKVQPLLQTDQLDGRQCRSGLHGGQGHGVVARPPDDSGVDDPGEFSFAGGVPDLVLRRVGVILEPK